MEYGNGTYAVYSYDAQLRRLANLKSYDANQTLMQDIDYQYDNMQNIVQTTNNAQDIGGMAGQYDYTHTYDSLYRLTHSMGMYHTMGTGYDLSMTYSDNGQILNKQLLADIDLNGAIQHVDYNRDYSYSGPQPNTVTEVMDQNSGMPMHMSWDANGNMTYFEDTQAQIARSLCWDEENRLMHVKDQNYMSSYIYDRTGERVWKMAGEVQQMSINGQYFIDQVVFNEKTLYTSPYMIVTEAEYTKHYYIESERVTTKLGGGFQPAPLNPMTDHVQYPIGKDYANLAEELWERLKYTEECTGLNPNYVTGEHNNLLYAVDQWTGMDNYESNAFYYHSDHLGSSSLITDANGQLDQHYQYLPFSRRDCADVRSTTQLARPNPDEPSSELRQGGEPFVSQKLNTGVRFTFSGKERDSETDYSYFGARYYSSDLSVWLSVDPKAHWYPSSSAYVYTMNNPVNLIDPNGMWVEGGGFFNNLFFSDEKVVEKMATKHANKIGGEVSEVDGGFRVSKVNYGDYDSEVIGEVYVKDYDVGKLSGQNDREKEKFSSDVNKTMNANLKNGNLIIEDFIYNYRFGKGRPAYVPIDLLKLDGITVKDFNQSNLMVQGHKAIQVNFDQSFYKDLEHALIFGTITLVQLNDNVIWAYPDTYNFDIKLGDNSPKTFVRNLGTMAGSSLNGNGQRFPIYFKGSIKIPYQ